MYALVYSVCLFLPKYSFPIT